jgi:hypothetical protein
MEWTCNQLPPTDCPSHAEATCAPLVVPTLAIVACLVFLTGCSSLLPRAKLVTEGPWQSYLEAQQTFDKIIPNQSTIEDLKTLKLDPGSNPNITILTYSDVIRRFIPSPSVNESDLAPGVKTCITAQAACKGYEVIQKLSKRTRFGGFWADFLNFKRKVDVTGWSFTGVILIKNDVVIYTLAGGQPNIQELEENVNPLGPFQGSGESSVRGALAVP